MSAQEKTLSDFFAVVQRRRRPAAVAGSVVLLGFVALAFGLPAVYQSSATLLIQQPEVAANLTGLQGPADYVEKRLQTVNQRVMTTENISALIKKFGLYAGESDGNAPEDVVGRFRASTLLTPSITEAVDARSMRSADLTYAFVVSFEYPDPAVAQQVAAALSEMFIRESESEKKEVASKTSAFLTTEADRLQGQLRETESKLAEFKQRFAGGLPEDRAQNLQRSQGALQQLAQVDGELRAAEARRDLVSTQMANTPMYRAVMGDTGQPVLEGADRLAAAQQELLAALAKYSEEHPDVKRLRREIASLTAETAAQGSTPSATNPEYQQLQVQLRSAEIAIQQLNARRAQIWAMQRSSELGLSQSPAIEREYTNLVRDYDMLQTQYKDVRARQQEAELAQKVESDSKGERYVLIDPAQVPDSPIRPDRVSLMLLGIVLALAVALGAASIVESADPTVRGQKDIATLLRMSPIGLIPVIDKTG
jgi:polysaccharide chain length determinant protein (PEP-CTERM system associated)